MVSAQLLYDRSPYPVQSLLFNIYAYNIHWRYGKSFEKKLEFLSGREKSSINDLEAFQSEYLKTLIADVYQNVPYYRDIMKSRRLKPGDFSVLEDLAKLPLLDKNIVKKEPSKFVNQSLKRTSLIMGSTSGTTGSSLQLFYDREACVWNNAFDWRQKRWAGIEYGMRVAFILGRPIVALNRVRGPFWQRDFVHNHLWLSAFHMSQENLFQYAEQIEKFGASAIEGYPSALYVLAKFLENQKLTLPMKAVFVSSEPLYDFQKKTIEKSFCCKVFNFYGMAERVAFATECDEHAGMHINYEYGIAELLDVETKSIVPDANSKGVLASTGLINRAMPLIRYQTNDVVSIDTSKCKCGRSSLRIPNVDTKLEDMIIRPDGTPISSSALTHPFKNAVGIKYSQIIQESENLLKVLVVKAETDGDRFNSNQLKESLQERIGKGFKIEVCPVTKIDRDVSGKFRWVVNKCK